jgi:hypothetical protein
MKTVKKILPAIVFFIAIAGSTQWATAQKPLSAKELGIKNAVDSQQYIFYAQSANPSGGRSRALTSEYTVTVLKDTISCDLPYFGRAYAAPMSSDAGIKFAASTNFEYKLQNRKKGGWSVTIKPKDSREVQELFFTIFSNGSASLHAISTNRQPISFNGYITQRKKKK